MFGAIVPSCSLQYPRNVTVKMQHSSFRLFPSPSIAMNREVRQHQTSNTPTMHRNCSSLCSRTNYKLRLGLSITHCGETPPQQHSVCQSARQNCAGNPCPKGSLQTCDFANHQIQRCPSIKTHTLQLHERPSITMEPKLPALTSILSIINRLKNQLALNDTQ